MPGIRRKAIDHLLECVDIMDATGSRDLKLWFADGTNYPGQDDIVARQDRLAAALSEVYDRLGDGQRMLLEYKLFEPSFYTTDVPDWGTAYAHCVALGPKALVVLDTGHHAPGTNIEFIVAMLLRARKLGGFDFNSRFYADDDLMVGAADPFQLFRIMWEVRRGGGLDPATGVAFMLDQCHNIEPKIAAQIRSVMNVQEATAKALLVDAEALAAAQQAGDVLGANAVFMDAYNTDVRPLLAESAGRAAASIPTRSRRTTGRATTSRSAPSARTAPPPAGEHEAAMTTDAEMVVDELVGRSNRLGADPRNTNYAGGNTSAKGVDVDPVTDADRSSCCGSRAAAATSARSPPDGLAVLRLDRVRALVDVYPGVDREDEMVAAFDFCRHGPGGAAPSIDTAMHALVEAPHVDHLHPDAGIALATAVDGEALTKECFGDRVVWVPWRRPGFQLGIDIAEVQRTHPASHRGHPRRSRHHGLGRHERGLRGQLARHHRHRPGLPRRSRLARAVRRRGRRERGRFPTTERRARAAALAPVIRGLASTDRPQVGHFDRRRRRARLLQPGEARSARRARHVVPRPLPAHEGAAAWSSTFRRRRRSTTSSPGSASSMRPTGTSTGRTTSGMPTQARRRCAAPTRRSCSYRVSACSPTAPTRSRRASPGSSTSTRST